ncbi:PQQ-dependent sugar dehydrogenase [Luteolibacter arcticus]|nr:PQQ-dependent sugar dehydrogenase [Luteolibacter arcticus]
MAWCLACLAFEPLIARTANGLLNVPATPPPTTVQVVDAFPGVTFNRALVFASPPGDEKRLFVGEIGGKIKVIPDVTAAAPTASVAIDLAAAITTPARTPAESWDLGPNLECGLLGFAFHPDYAANGYLFVFYSAAKASDPGVWYQRLSRFTVPPGEREQAAPLVDPGSELILLEQRDRGPNHNGGDVHFGPDGYLYLSVGDEDNPSDHFNNSQRIDMNFFGAMLRIDVDKKTGNLEPNAHTNPAASVEGFSAVDGIPRDESPTGSGVFKARYSIPIDNPYVPSSEEGTWDGTLNGAAIAPESLPYVRSEFWAIGLRSPWRFHIDQSNGEIMLGDVGQSMAWPAAPHAAEELNIIKRGGNFGWPYREGTFPGPKTAPPGFTSLDPFYQLDHNIDGDPNYRARCFIGGVIYRGSRFASLTGSYVFGDFISGNIWALTRPGGVPAVQRIAGLGQVVTFGTDPSNGDVLLTDYSGTRIRRLVTATPGSAFPNTLGATGLFTDLATLTPAPAVVPYSVNLSFWSDHAVKRRWFSIPDGTSRMTWSREDAWTFPAGQIWVKHFDLETERGNPESPKKRIETRVLVKNPEGIYGVSYRWNAAGTQATLAADGGETFAVEVIKDGAPYSQTWNIPSRAQCNICHTPEAGYALSFNTLQLNLEGTIEGFTGNQLDFLESQGYLTNSPDSPNVLPRHLRPEEEEHPIEARVRSYLAVNCGYCHAGAAGTAPTAWDGRHGPILDQTGLIRGEATSAQAPYKLVLPGDPAHSLVLRRMAGTGGFSRMPPLATSEPDAVNIELMTEWINLSLPDRKSYAEWRLEVFGSATSPEGEPGADADDDGQLNHAEFLAGSQALDPGSFLVPVLSLSEGAVLLDAVIPANRSVQVERSTNLLDWSLWDVPGNHGLAHPGGPAAFTGPMSGGGEFFRIRLRER